MRDLQFMTWGDVGWCVLLMAAASWGLLDALHLVRTRPPPDPPRGSCAYAWVCRG